MIKRKRFRWVLVAAALAVAATGCGAGQDDPAGARISGDADEMHGVDYYAMAEVFADMTESERASICYTAQDPSRVVAANREIGLDLDEVMAFFDDAC